MRYTTATQFYSEILKNFQKIFGKYKKSYLLCNVNSKQIQVSTMLQLHTYRSQNVFVQPFGIVKRDVFSRPFGSGMYVDDDFCNYKR